MATLTDAQIYAFSRDILGREPNIGGTNFLKMKNLTTQQIQDKMLAEVNKSGRKNNFASGALYKKYTTAGRTPASNAAQKSQYDAAQAAIEAEKSLQWSDKQKATASEIARSQVNPQFRQDLETHLDAYGLGSGQVYKKDGDKNGYFVYENGKWARKTEAQIKKLGFDDYKIKAAIPLKPADFNKYKVGGSEQANLDFTKKDLLQQYEQGKQSAKGTWQDKESRLTQDYQDYMDLKNKEKDEYFTEWFRAQPLRQEAIGAQAADSGLYNSGQRQETQREDTRQQGLQKTGYERDWQAGASTAQKTKERGIGDASKAWQEYLQKYQGDVTRANQAYQYDTQTLNRNRAKEQRNWFTDRQDALTGNIDNQYTQYRAEQGYGPSYNSISGNWSMNN